MEKCENVAHINVSFWVKNRLVFLSFDLLTIRVIELMFKELSTGLPTRLHLGQSEQEFVISKNGTLLSLKMKYLVSMI